MTKILYGASVQGIQNFIFQTNKLKDIIGASELVERACTTAFAEQIGADTESLHQNENMILMAAGNIIFIFDDENKCRDTVLNFPKKVMEMAPGITISQATVCMDGKFSDYAAASQELQNRLMAQRNKPMRPLVTGLIGVKHSRQTGMPAVSTNKTGFNDDFLDLATLAKRKVAAEISESEKKFLGLARKNFGEQALKSMKTVKTINELTGKNDWIAIVHADGNGLGQIIQKIGKDKSLFKQVSSCISSATVSAAQKAFKAISDKFDDSCQEESEAELKKKIQLRPIVLNGDDHTVVIRGDLAIEYAASFIRYFEESTKQEFLKIDSGNQEFKSLIGQGLTACAGIAYIKSSYPFYYGYGLAEELCSYAKKESKAISASKRSTIIPSCIMFHKVQDSFTEDYREITRRELSPNDSISFRHGPYYIHEDDANLDGSGNIRWTVDLLLDTVNKLNGPDGSPVKTHLRQWISILHKRNGLVKGQQFINRLKSTAPHNMLDVIKRCTTITSPDATATNPTYDILALSTITFQETK